MRSDKNVIMLLKRIKQTLDGRQWKHNKTALVSFECMQEYSLLITNNTSRKLTNLTSPLILAALE